MPNDFEGLGGFPGELCSSYIHIGNTITQIRVTLQFSGTLKFFINADDDENHWEEVINLVSGKVKQYTLNYSGGRIRYRIVGTSGARLFNTYTTGLQKKKPAILIELLE